MSTVIVITLLVALGVLTAGLIVAECFRDAGHYQDRLIEDFNFEVDDDL